MMRRVTVPAVLALATLARADAPQRHVYVADLSDEELAWVVGEDDAPAFVVAGEELVGAPTSGEQPGPDEATLAAPAPSASAPPPEMHPDRLTDTTTATDYYEAFTPSVAPHKRAIAFDAVREDADGTPVLVLSDRATSPVELGETGPSRPRDAFFGSVVLDFSAGTRVAIPSVAPDARILHVRTEPDVPVRVVRDVAGNHFAEVDVVRGGSVRLTFLTDVARGYFARPLPRQRIDALAAEVPPVPPSVRQRGLALAAELGVRADQPVAEGLARLVEHFRGFREGDPPPGTGDTYLDLARGGVGVCRHRAYAFVVTALSLGLPAHFVQNEAHAWVEVRLRDGYLRIDLGGGTADLQAHGTQDRPHHVAEHDDPFPRPDTYVATQTQQQFTSDLGGASGDAPGTRATPDQGATASDTPSDHAAAEAATTPTAARSLDAGAGPQAMTPTEAVEASTEGAADAGVALDARLATRLEVHAARHRVHRGQMLDVAGRLVADDGAAVAGARIEIGVEPGRLLGVVLTDADGRFAASVGIPPDVGLGDHVMRVEYVGSPRYAPTRAR